MKKLVQIYLFLNLFLNNNNILCSQQINHKAIKEITEIIDNNSLNKIQYNKINDLILKQISAVDDYSLFLNKEEYNEIQSQLSDEFVGIGMMIKKGLKNIEVVDVVESSPAKRAGVKKGDIIIEAEGEEVNGVKNYETLIKNIKGKVGTSFNFKVLRNKNKINFSIIREKINLSSVDHEVIDDYLIVKIKYFNENTEKELRNILFNFPLENLIIDLRNNPGGFLHSVVKVANLFLNKDTDIINIIDKNSQIIYSYKAVDDIVFIYNKKIKLLTNEKTVSAAELLALTLKENGICDIYGKNTYGKSSVQEFIALESIPGSFLKLSIGRYQSPKGYIISKEGIKPDFYIKDIDKMNYKQIIKLFKN